MQRRRSITQLSPVERACAIPVKFTLKHCCADKLATEKWMDYLNRKGISVNKLKKLYHFKKCELDRLRMNESFDDCDDTILLSKIVRAVTCNSTSEAEEDAYEVLQSLLKDNRNNRDKTSHSWFKDFHNSEDDLSENVLKTGVGVMQCAVDMCGAPKEDMERATLKIMSILTNESEQDIYIRENFATIEQDARLEVSEKERLNYNMISLFNLYPRKTMSKFDLGSVFSDIDVTIRPKQSPTSNEDNSEDVSIINYSQLLSVWPRHPEKEKIILLSGMTGTGKTITIKKLLEAHCQENFENFPGLKEFNFVVYFACKDPTVKNLEDLIKRFYSKTLSKHNLHVDDILSRNVLYLVDGLEEQARESSAIIHSILKNLEEGRGRMVCTTRPHNIIAAVETFNNIEFQMCSLMGILDVEKQKAFMLKYNREISSRIGRCNETKIIESFERCRRLKFTSFFTYPLSLVLFVYLNVYADVEEDEWNFEVYIYQKTLEHYKRKVIDRIRNNERIRENPEPKVEKVMKRIFEHALTSTQKNSYVLSPEEYEKLVYELFIIDSDFPVDEILCVFMQPISEIGSAQGKHYLYLHKSIRDYFASIHMISLLEAKHNKNKTLREILCNLLEEEPNTERFEDATIFAISQLIWKPDPKIEHLKKLSRFLGRKFFSTWWRILQDSNFTSKAYDNLDKMSVLMNFKLQGMVLEEEGSNMALAFSNSDLIPFDVVSQITNGVSKVKDLCYFDQAKYKKFSISKELITIENVSNLPRFRIVMFKVCLNDGCGDLFEHITRESCYLSVALLDPSQHTLYNISSNKLKFLEVCVKFSSFHKKLSRRPLPKASFLRLVVYGVTKGRGKRVSSIIETLAPSTERYDCIELRNSHLKQDEAAELEVDLKRWASSVKIECAEKSNHKKRTAFKPGKIIPQR